MAVTMELYELKNLCMDMAELGAANYAKRVSPGNDRISQREAYRQFGAYAVKRWVDAGIVTRTRSGSSKNSKVTYSRAELIAAGTSDKIRFKI